MSPMPRPRARPSSDCAPACRTSTGPNTAQRRLWLSDPAYIDAALNSIDREYGSVDLYLQNGLGLTQADIGSLRARLTQ